MLKNPLNLFLIAFSVSLDQGSKWLVESWLPFQRKIDLIPYLAFFRTHNEGIAFSFMAWMNDTVLALGTVVIIAFVLWLWSQVERERVLLNLGYALIVGGALGNLIDRALHGYVVDFILFHTQTWSFAVFNVADSFITVGAGAIILAEVLDISRQRRNNSNPDTK